MKIWVDDIRTPPDGYWWVKTSEDFIDGMEVLIREGWRGDQIEVVSLDHDLGGDDTTRPIVLWFCENDFWPVEVVVHSANYVGVEWLEGMIERYHPKNAHKYTER